MAWTTLDINALAIPPLFSSDLLVLLIGPAPHEYNNRALYGICSHPYRTFKYKCTSPLQLNVNYIRGVFTSNQDDRYISGATFISEVAWLNIICRIINFGDFLLRCSPPPPISWLAAAGPPVGLFPLSLHTLQWHRSAILLTLSLSPGKVSRK